MDKKNLCGPETGLLEIFTPYTEQGIDAKWENEHCPLGSLNVSKLVQDWRTRTIQYAFLLFFLHWVNLLFFAITTIFLIHLKTQKAGVLDPVRQLKLIL